MSDTTNESKFIPWEACRDQTSLFAEVYIEGTSQCIATVYNHQPGSLPTARLVAAAPTMRAALKRLVLAVATQLTNDPDALAAALTEAALALEKAGAS